MSTPVVLGAAWSAVVLTGAWLRRPRQTRRLVATTRTPGAAVMALARVGRSVRSAVGLPANPRSDRVLGWALVAGAALLVTAPLLAPVPVVGAAAWARVAERRRRRDAHDAWASALPDTVDLFALALASGMTVPSALRVVAPRSPAPVGPALVDAEARFRHGEPLADALARVADAGPPARPLVSVLTAAHCDGLPVAEPLARLGSDLRDERRRTAESRARQTPVRLLFPLVLCTLPAFVLVTVVPPVITALDDLGH
jgi:tight adherence protein C